jgi:hypothetical protein
MEDKESKNKIGWSLKVVFFSSLTYIAAYLLAMKISPASYTIITSTAFIVVVIMFLIIIICITSIIKTLSSEDLVKIHYERYMFDGDNVSSVTTPAAAHFKRANTSMEFDAMLMIFLLFLSLLSFIWGAIADKTGLEPLTTILLAGSMFSIVISLSTLMDTVKSLFTTYEIRIELAKKHNWGE